MVKRTKGYIAALILVCIIVVGYATNVTKEQEGYAYEEGKLSAISEEAIPGIEEYFMFVNEAMHPGDEVRSQIYFRDYELEKDAPVPSVITKYTVTKAYGECFVVQATAVTWGEGKEETLVFAYTELVEDKSGVVKYHPYMCERIEEEGMVFGFFEYTITIPNDGKKIKVDELQKLKFEESSDRKRLTLSDSIMLIKDIEAEEPTE